MAQALASAAGLAAGGAMPQALTNSISGLEGAMDLLTSVMFRSSPANAAAFPPGPSALNGDEAASGATALFGAEYNHTADNGTNRFSPVDFQQKPALFLAQSVLNLVLASSSPLYPFIMTLLSAFSPILDGFLQQYLHNDFFAGSVWLVALGLMGRHFLSWFYWGLDWMRHRGNVTVTISPNDEAFVWIQEWLNGYKKLRPTEFTLNLHYPDGDEDNNADVGRNKPQIKFLPKLKAAQHITFKGSKVTFQMRNSPGQLEGGGDFGDILRSMGREELVIEAPSQSVLLGVIQAAADAALTKKAEKKTTTVKRWSGEDQYWKYLGDRGSRPVSSVVLDCDADALITDVKQFLASAKWYTDRGIPHRRGYLFYGPPGCGKTSLIQALAGELDFGVSLISLSSTGMNDDSLHSAMADCEEREVIVLEDIDAAFTADRAKSEGSRAEGLSFSGLLNAIDGLSANEKRIVIMTTNHIERLDPALIRPGRVDFRMFLGLASRSQITRLFARFYEGASSEEAERFAGLFEEGMASPAALQGFFLLHRDDLEGAMKHGVAFAERVREEARERERKEKEKEGKAEEEAKGEAKGEGKKRVKAKTGRVGELAGGRKGSVHVTSAAVEEEGESGLGGSGAECDYSEGSDTEDSGTKGGDNEGCDSDSESDIERSDRNGGDSDSERTGSTGGDCQKDKLG